MTRPSASGDPILATREWIATTLGTALILYEAVIEHSAHKEPYAVALVLLGYVPFSIFDRLLGRWGGDRNDKPTPDDTR